VARLDHISLNVRDWRASRDWWTGHLGLEVEFEMPNGVAVKDEADLTIFLQQGEVTIPAGLAFTVQVDDVDARHEELSAAGVAFVHPPARVFWGYGAELLDPDGYRLRLWDPKTMKTKGAA
jgi:catechol 2,3-dioxygenase-like lactoylglutathione lyase family enzyme